VTDAGYIAAGYLVTGVTLIAYAARVIYRSRVLGRALPREEQRWR